MLNETSDMVFKDYLTSKTQAWFWRRGRYNPAATPLPPSLPVVPGASALQRPRVHRKCSRTGGGLGGGPTGGGLNGTHHVALTLAHHLSGCVRRRGRASLVEEDNISLSLILNLLSLMLPRETSAELFQARFRRWKYTP